MNRRNGPKIDLKLNLSAPQRPNVESPNQSPSTMSPTSSCVSSDDSSSPEGKAMLLVGCPRCLMYVMLAEKDPKCPKCKSSVLLNVVHDENNNNKNKNKKN